MNRMVFLPRFRLLGLAMSLTVLAGGCKPPAPATGGKDKEAPAKVANGANEGELKTIKLKAQAEQDFALAVASAELKSVPRISTYGGEVMLPPGASLVVAAPFSGTPQAPGKECAPGVGMLVAAKQPVCQFHPRVAPEREALTPAERVRYAEARNAIATSRIDAAGQLEQAEVQLEAAKIARERAERLFNDGAGTARAVDDAKAQHQ